tara:strand:- start:92 stop:739 length:648 start_codon:yes stop_codon:yes gene_type:complete
MKLIFFKHLFPNITENSWELLETWVDLLKEWNKKINLISRKDIEALEERHLMHCLAVTNVLKLKPGAQILDVGTGGGLPGLPMAICYPEAQFTLIDSIGKKVNAVADISDSLGLKNVEVLQIRAEAIETKFDFITGRAVKNLPEFINWIKNNVRSGSDHSLENGLLYWKGGLFENELSTLKAQPSNSFKLGVMLKNSYFSEKFLLHFCNHELQKV